MQGASCEWLMECCSSAEEFRFSTSVRNENNSKAFLILNPSTDNIEVERDVVLLLAESMAVLDIGDAGERDNANGSNEESKVGVKAEDNAEVNSECACCCGR